MRLKQPLEQRTLKERALEERPLEQRPGVHLRLTMIAALLSMLGPFTIDTYLPSFPDIALYFDINRAILSHSLGIYLGAFSISLLFWGPLADRVGRRIVVLVSLMIYTLASIACALAENYDSFLLMRMIQGLAASGGFVAGRAMIRDAHDAQTAQKAMSQVMLMFALAPAIAPILGGWLHTYFGWHSVFWFLASFALLLLCLVVLIRETLPISHRQSLHPIAVWQTYKQTVQHRAFLTLALSTALSFAGLFLYIAGAPVVIYDFLGLGSRDFGLLFIPMVAGMMLGSAIASRKAHDWTPQAMISIGFALMLLAWLLNMLQATCYEATVFLVIAPMVFYTLGLSLTMPGLTILAMDFFPQKRGSAASMQGFLQMLISAATASIAVPLLQTSRLHFVLGQGALLLCGLILWLLFIRQNKHTIAQK